MLNTDMHNKQVVWGPQFQIAAGGFRKICQEGGRMVSWLALLSILSFGHMMAYGAVLFLHSFFTVLEAQKMWDNKKFVVGLKGWKGKE